MVLFTNEKKNYDMIVMGTQKRLHEKKKFETGGVLFCVS